MFKIGDFSRLSQVSVKALRHYDGLGLLRPEHVDRLTGYRYYSAEQLPRLNRIIALKDLGFSLDEISELLRDQVPSEQIRGMLRVKRSELRQHIEYEQERLGRVEARLRQIEREDQPSMHEVILKSVESQLAASVRETIPTHPDVGALFHHLAAYLCQRHVSCSAPPIAIYHDLEYRTEDIDVQVAFPLAAPVDEDERVKMVTVPPIELAACVVHRGTHETIGEAYAALMAWVQTGGYRPSGPSRLVYIQTPEADPTATEVVTEVQLPVQRAN